jgi:hypothetical protein
LLNLREFLLSSGLKNHREHRVHREKLHRSVLSVYSVVEKLCSNSLFQENLKSLKNPRECLPLSPSFIIRRKSLYSNAQIKNKPQMNADKRRFTAWYPRLIEVNMIFISLSSGAVI